MSFTVIKAGILDTVQDVGRIGYRSLGIGPSGAMDIFSAQLAHALLGNNCSATIEMHYPAAVLRFNAPAIICLTGADFSPAINGLPVQLNQPVVVSPASELSFGQLVKGARCYLAIWNGLNLQPWLKSYSTNLFASAGGYLGRQLKKNDTLEFLQQCPFQFLPKQVVRLPFRANPPQAPHKIAVVKAANWNNLSGSSQENFFEKFTIGREANRMGYRLNGPGLTNNASEQLSSAANFGTVQLVPAGDLIILMADHQTTGGYPKIANVISAHLPFIAQLQPGNSLEFEMVELPYAQNLLWQQYIYLATVKHGAYLNLKKWLSKSSAT